MAGNLPILEEAAAMAETSDGDPDIRFVLTPWT